MKLYIVANRLPVKASASSDGTFCFLRSEGGLATGLDSLKTDYEKHWIGWPGLCTEKDEEKETIRTELIKLNFHPVFLSSRQYDDYYEGYCNSTIWPLCHYFFSYTKYNSRYADAYREVNSLFCEEICRTVEPDSWVWVQDYQLMLLPAMLRKRMPELHIGYFHHIPFPSYELFRILPERAQLLRGLLGADFIAFHTYDYLRHFISAVQRVLLADIKIDEVSYEGRAVKADALPMGINYDLYHRASDNAAVWEEVKHTRMLFGRHKMILSVDRLDYSKGILQRLEGFSSFLEHHPEYHGKVVLSMVIVPSRDHVESYAEMKKRIDQEISVINGRYSTMEWTPVCYFYHGFSFEKLVAMYYVADIALVTPLRDGMNLVCKEYVAVKNGNPGVLILSEMAGAAAELTDALQINPNDTSQIENAILRALEMPVEEQCARIAKMQRIVSRQTVGKWASDFLGEWEEAVLRNRELRDKLVTPAVVAEMNRDYAKASRRLIMLDYDGTLAAFRNRPEDAVPTKQLKELLARLSADSRNNVVINSGRDHTTMEKWLGKLGVSMAAEHGAYFKEHGLWHKKNISNRWSNGIMSILNMFTERTPGSRIEVKDTAVAWHYRDVDLWLGAFRARQLIDLLMPLCMKQNLQILNGSKVVEIKSPEFTKGSEVQRLLSKDSYDFILAMGDDTTDEDMFRALPPTAVTVKVGAVSDNARYNLPRQSGVVKLISDISSGEAGCDAPERKSLATRAADTIRQLFGKHTNR